MLEFRQVSKKYLSRTVLKEISFQVEPGELVVLIGSSGCGKTTTLKMINRLIEPTSGQIFLRGKDIQELDPIALRLGIGYVIQRVGLIPHMTVAENIELVPYLRGWDRKRRRDRVLELMELVNLSPDLYQHKKPAMLSGGQQQRVGIARALATEPDLILMDEPFSALDPLTRAQLQDELKTLQSRVHKTIVLVSHDMNEALGVADRIIFMQEGNIVQMGPPREFLTSPTNDVVSSFFSNASYLRNSHLIFARDMVLEDYPYIHEDTPLSVSAELFDSTEEEFVLVLDNERRCKGYVTAKELNKNPLDALLSQIVLRQPRRIAADTPSGDVVQLFQTNKHLLFVSIEDENGKVLGIMTREGVIHFFAQLIERARRGEDV